MPVPSTNVQTQNKGRDARLSFILWLWAQLGTQCFSAKAVSKGLFHNHASSLDTAPENEGVQKLNFWLYRCLQKVQKGSERY